MVVIIKHSLAVVFFLMCFFVSINVFAMLGKDELR